MVLSDLTKAGILTAIEEFDEIGREAFLTKYKFKKSKSYFLVKNGRRYDSKAIAGAAAKYSRPGESPLTAADFSGGEATVQRVLERLGFEVAYEPTRNPDWSRDELILALDFYMRHRDRMPDKSSSEIIELSNDISKLGEFIHGRGDETFRNANGVYMKAMNFRRFDPRFREMGRAGLSRGGRGDELVWGTFANSPHALVEAATAIRATLALAGRDDEMSAQLSQSIEDEFAEAPEGQLMARLHRTRERNKKIIQQKKSTVLRDNGKLICEACTFDFEKTYGERGRGFIECHHLRPVSEMAANSVTRLSDLALLCSNCHRMIHAKNPWLSLDELRQLIGK